MIKKIYIYIYTYKINERIYKIEFFVQKNIKYIEKNYCFC